MAQGKQCHGEGVSVMREDPLLLLTGWPVAGTFIFAICCVSRTNKKRIISLVHQRLAAK